MASNQLIASPFCLSVFPYINCLLNRKHNPIFPISSSVSISETRLGDFWKLMETNFLTIIAKIFRDLLGYFERHHFLSKNYCGYFLGNFWKYLGYFVFRHLVTRVFIFNLSFYPHIFPLPNSNLNISFYLSSHLFIPTLNGGFLFSTTVRKVFFSRFDFISVFPFIFAHASTQPSFTFLSLLCLPSKSVQTGLLFLSKTCLFQGFLFHSSFLHCGSPATTAARLSRPLWIGSGPPPALRRVRACPGAVWWRETQ